ncbi:15367_t:CDS:2, partial [Rhizophagus irregularis]
RLLHSSILVDKKLYIFGGFRDNSFSDTIESTYNLYPDDRFFYLDVSKPFDTSKLPWTAIKDNKNLPLNNFSSVLSGGVAAILTFNTSDYSWNSLSQPNITGDIPIGRNKMKPITDRNGKIYLLAGFNFTTLQNAKRNGGMFIFDTINSSCVLNYHDIYTRMLRVEYSATLLLNDIIVYMGGKGSDGTNFTDGFSTVYLYYTNNSTWASKPTTGSIPKGDNGISSVLGLDGFRIIVFCGVDIDNKMLYVLDTTNYNWSEPNVSGKGPIMKRFDHTANVIGKYMVIAFGSGPGLDFNYREEGESDVLLLDIVFGVLGMICITSLSIFFFIKRRKKSLNETTFPIPDNGENVKSDLEISSRASGSNTEILLAV